MSEASIGYLITVGQWTIGAIISLIVVAIRLSWQASRLNSAVESGTVAVNDLKSELVKTQSDLKDEVRIIHNRIDKHEERIDRVEVQVGHPGSGTRYDIATQRLEGGER